MARVRYILSLPRPHYPRMFHWACPCEVQRCFFELTEPKNVLNFSWQDTVAVNLFPFPVCRQFVPSLAHTIAKKNQSKDWYWRGKWRQIPMSSTTVFRPFNLHPDFWFEKSGSVSNPGKISGSANPDFFLGLHREKCRLKVCLRVKWKYYMKSIMNCCWRSITK